MSDIVMSGLDGKNPLAFLAALGVLEALTDAMAPGAPPTLSWRAMGSYAPVLQSALPRDALLDLLVRDAEGFADEPALDLRYPKQKEGAVAHDLKPPPSLYAGWLKNVVDSARPRSLALAAAFATDVAVDNNGNTKPTALHFTAGQQEFLAMVCALREGVTRADFEEALFGPWKYTRELPVLQWDNSQARDYALRAGDPSKEKKTGVPGADWLAFRGLANMVVAPVGTQIKTAGCHGGWKTGAFRWPIWRTPIPRAVVRSLVTSPELLDVNPRVLQGRGIDVVFESSIRRSDQGGYGSLSPARVATREAR